jgi:protein-S-isoprenylcysteine O-methyltransferase Ste14
VKQKFYIDTHKGITGIVVLAMMAIYQQWENPTAWVYLALHGSYGLFWVLKSNLFPDKSWERVIGFGFGLVNWFGLSLYWIAPWILTSKGVQAPGWYLGLCITLYVFGVFLHFSTDMQKYTSLRLRPNQLITSGFMQRTRNMNYLGELLIYLGFGLLAMHWLPVLILGLFVAIIWIPNMLRKDRSLARYAEFGEYRQKSKFFVPFLF